MAIVTAHVAAVQELYVAYFGRPADTAGLDYWTNVVEANAGATAAVSAAFAASPEYIVTYFGQTNTQIVNNIYQNLFGRDADAAGSAYWANLLTNGTIKIDTIVAEVAAAALTTDAEAVENKVSASTAFTAALDTPAENAGYAGNSALTLAKAFIKSVTTDATLATAIAPANLTAQVAAVVKAGTPFSLTTSLVALENANEALADFLDANDLPAVVADARTEVTGNVTAATTAVDALITADYTAASTAVKAALLADQQRTNAAAVTTATTAVTNANADAAAVAGLTAAIANLRAATTANADAIELAAETQVDLNVATSTFNLRNEFPAIIAANGTATVDGDPLLILNARGQLVVAAGVTEADFPGVTALREAIIADLDADIDAGLAATALSNAAGEDLIVDNGPLVTAVVNANATLELRQDAVTNLAEAVADRVEALALQTQFNAAVAAVTDAGAAFELNGYRAPVALDVDGSFAATSGSDIFTLGEADTITISAFGRTGTDSLYVGSQFVLNTGDLDSGNNAALEVFFVQNGTRTEVHVEQAAFGSASDDVTIITLVGVDADDLQLVNGIISLKATTV
ncbi:DUF4214 domain-containing protein [Massilia aurea]|uniref:DUF4214 domain-containing protein n=1 Tax=Massilia aurea TaxID=373040 RepID=UPI003461CBBA